MPGRCIFTTTASPVFEPGPVCLGDRCGADRLPVELREELIDAAAQFGLELGLHGIPGGGVDVALEEAELGPHLRGHEIGPGRGHLAQLDEHGAALFERPAQGQPDGDSFLGGPSASRETGGRRQAVPVGDVDQLPVAGIGFESSPEVPDGTRDREQPGPLPPGQGAGTGGEVESQGGDHRQDYREADRGRRQLGSVPVPVGQTDDEQVGRCPADGASQGLAHPGAPHPEQACSDQRGHDGDRHLEQELGQNTYGTHR